MLSTSLLALSACGDDADEGSSGGGAACAEAQACGGDPTGSWTIAETCLDPSMFAELIESAGKRADQEGRAHGERARSSTSPRLSTAVRVRPSPHGGAEARH
ncbi:hypothetical protein ACMHYB_03015 [Sorangium sp. So ce1128]